MEINIYDAKTHFSRIIQSLIDGHETEIIISKNGKPVAQIIPFCKKLNKRLGIAKEELRDFNLTQDEFDSIEIMDFLGD